MRRVWTAIAVVTVGVVALAGCGGDSGGGAYVEPKGPAIETVKFVGTSYEFTPSKATAPAGIIEIELESEDIIHSLRIRGVAGFLIEAGSGKTASKKVELAPGEYEIYCDIPGHESQGMVGTLTVE